MTKSLCGYFPDLRIEAAFFKAVRVIVMYLMNIEYAVDTVITQCELWADNTKNTAS